MAIDSAVGIAGRYWTCDSLHCPGKISCEKWDFCLTKCTAFWWLV